jgi:LmbE family N-acetylglucosaminyl deacetylase
MHHLFLSPHADDAIACCGGTLAQLLATEQTASIYTLFCGTAVAPFSPAATALHATWSKPKDVQRLRRAEDEAAAARLGVPLAYGDALEAPYRRDPHGQWLYADLPAIFGTRHPADEALLTQLLDTIRGHIPPRQTRLYVPLGIGQHVDHLLLCEVGQVLQRQGYDVMWYEDFPYALQKAAYQHRLAALAHLQATIVSLSEAALLAKIEAFSYYRSQIPMLFTSYANMPVEFIAYAKAVGGTQAAFGERFWSIPR